MDLARWYSTPAPAPSAPAASPAPSPPPAVAPAPSPPPSSPAPAPSATDGDDLRAAADPPAAPASLSFDLPSDFKAPPDIPLSKVNPADPLAKAAAKFAREQNLSQQQFSGLLRVYAEHAVSEAKAYRESITREGQKLGPNAAARGQAVKEWLAGKLGAEHAADLTARFTRASDIEAFEKLQRGDARATPAQSIEARWYGAR